MIRIIVESVALAVTGVLLTFTLIILLIALFTNSSVIEILEL